MNINENMLVGELLDGGDAYADVLLSFGMPCLGCPGARGETLAEACEIHGIDKGQLLLKLGSIPNGHA